MSVSFLGTDVAGKTGKNATVESMSQETKDKIDKKVKDLQDVPDTFSKAGNAINDSLGAINDTLKGTTEKVGAISVAGAGLVTTLKKPFVSLINWMKEPLKDEEGKIVKKVLEDGKEIIVKGDKFCKNKVIGVAVAAGVAALGIITSIIVKHVQNKKAEAQEAQKEQGQNLDVTSTDEDSDK